MNAVRTLRQAGPGWKYAPTCAACDTPAAWVGYINCCGDTAYACDPHRAVEDDSMDMAHATHDYFHPACGQPIARDIQIQWTRVPA